MCPGGPWWGAVSRVGRQRWGSRQVWLRPPSSSPAPDLSEVLRTHFSGCVSGISLDPGVHARLCPRVASGLGKAGSHNMAMAWQTWPLGVWAWQALGRERAACCQPQGHLCVFREGPAFSHAFMPSPVSQGNAAVTTTHWPLEPEGLRSPTRATWRPPGCFLRDVHRGTAPRFSPSLWGPGAGTLVPPSGPEARQGWAAPGL